MTRDRHTTTTERPRAAAVGPEMLWLLNCYDRWSATPRLTEDCNCFYTRESGATRPVSGLGA